MMTNGRSCAPRSVGWIGLGVARGIVIAHHSLTPEDLIALGMAIGDEAELEAQFDADVADADTKE